MKDLIKKLLKEQLDNQIQNLVDDILKRIKELYPNIKVNYSFGNNGRLNFTIDTLDNSVNGVLYNNIRHLIWDKTGNQNILVSINPSKNLINKFENTQYIKNILPILKREKLNVKNYFIDFDGKKNPYLDLVIKNVKNIEKGGIEKKITEFIKSKTDVPLKIEFISQGPNSISINIFPQLSLDDFLNCKYKKWFSNPSNPKLLENEILNIIRSNQYFSGEQYYHVFYKIIWPRDIGSFIVDKNKELRDLLPNTFNRDTSVAIDYGVCPDKPTFLIGRSSDGPFNQVVNDRKKANKIIKQYYPQAKERLTLSNNWDVKSMYSIDDKTYWNKEKLFNFFVDKVKNTYGDIYEYDIDKFKDLDSPVEVFCKQHQRWFEVLPNEHIDGKRCPFDNESKGESMVRVFLEKRGINLKQYHRIKECFSEVNGKCYTLPFDFFLPDLNILIEYDGEQHYRPVDIWGGEEGFKRQQVLDNIKNKFAEHKGIKLIRIPYTIKKENQLSEYLTNDVLGIG